MADPDFNLEKAVIADQAAVRAEKMRRRALIDSAFPAMGTPRGSHEGSQSDAPTQNEESSPVFSNPGMPM